MVTFNPASIPLENILLDPNNFRFKRPDAIFEILEKRFAEESVQAQALRQIREDGVKELKASIRENGFIPVERIVVRRVPSGDGDSPHYVAVEGNRRTAALKLLQADHAAGVDLPETITATFMAVPVLIAEDASDDDLLAIMGIRHVGGPKEWGGYQSARLVYQLIHESNISPSQTAERLGLSTREVNRRARAFAALEHMRLDDSYGDEVTPEMYPIFHEILSQTKLKEWLAVNDKTSEFENDENKNLLYSWLVDDDDRTAQLTSYRDVRSLRQVIDNEDAYNAFVNDGETLEAAHAMANAQARANKWLYNAKTALESLKDMNTETIQSLDSSSIEILQNLRKRARIILQAHELSLKEDDDEDYEED